MAKELESKERYASCRLQELRLELAQLMAVKSQIKKGKEMVSDAVVVTSDKLYFPIPLDKYIMNTVVARNISEVPVSFKMKATDPTRYAVKPRQGTIPAFSCVEISVTLKPTTIDPSGLHDKFLLECRHLQPTITCPGCGMFAGATTVPNPPPFSEPPPPPPSDSSANPVTMEELEMGKSSSVFQQSHSCCCSLRIKCKFTSLLPANFQLRRVNNGEPVVLSPLVSAVSTPTTAITTSTSTSTSTSTTPTSRGSLGGGYTAPVALGGNVEVQFPPRP